MTLSFRYVAAVYLFILCSCLQLSGQTPWSTFLDPTRAVDWSTAGFTIPSYSVNCPTQPTMLTGSGNAGANATAIQNALNSCDATHNVVNIPSGTYYIAGITYPAHGKQVVRGAGANSTHLISTAQAGCEGFNAGICMINASPIYTGSSDVLPGGAQACNSWSAGYSQGTTSITVTGCGGTPPLNQMIALDQADDSSDTGGVYVCDETTPASCNYDGTGGSVGRVISGKTHSQVQFTQVTAVASLGGGSYTLTISPAVYFTNVRTGQTPGAWWPGQTQLNGLENLSVDGTADNFATVGMYACYQCWTKGVTLLNGARDSVYMRLSMSDVVRDSYFYQAQGHASVSYNVEPSLASAVLVENNIMQQTTEPAMFNGCTGCVVDYNFGVDQIAFSNYTWGIFSGHSAGNTFNLFEGNNAPWDQEDDAWGSTTQTTDFRNAFRGWELGRTQASTPIIRRSYNRVDNIIGNILGQPGYHTGYQTIATSNTTVSGGSEDLNIYTLGTAFDTSCGTGTAQSSPFCDTLGVSTLMRWGNYDVVTAGVKWDSTEASPGAVTYAAANFSSGYFGGLAHTLPASLIYASTPSWWPGGKAWPPIGPDVSGGNVGLCSGGTYANAQATSSGQCGGTLSTAWASHVTSIPAQDCYLNTMGGPPDGTGSVLSFNPTACYSASPQVATPAFSPTSLSAPGYVTISSSTPAATIYYTTDGSAPTTASAVYQYPIWVWGTQTLKALGTASGYINSIIGTQSFSFTSPKTRFSISRQFPTQSPVPFPQDDRMCCQPSTPGTTVGAIEPSNGTFNWTAYDNWVTTAASHGSTVEFTYQGRPIWMTGLPANTDGPASDLNTVTSCPAVGGSTTDCFLKTFTIALLKHVTGLSAQPVAPVTCNHLDYIEYGNEVNTYSGSSSLVGWTGTPAQFAQTAVDQAQIVNAWCSNTKNKIGSFSAIVGANGTGNPQYDVYAAAILTAIGPANAGLFQGISYHSYGSRQTVIPTPPPTGITSYSSSLCTGTSNNNCYVSIATETTVLRNNALKQAGTITWSGNLPIYDNEGGFGEIAQLNGDNTFGIAHTSEYITLLASQGTALVDLYAAQEAPCGSTNWGCYWQTATSTPSPWYQAVVQTTSWLNAGTIGACTTASITGGTGWTCPLNGGTSEIDFCAVQNPATCTKSTSFTHMQDINGTITNLSGTVTLNSTAALLFNGATAANPTFSPVAGSYGTTQTVTISTYSGTVICYNTTGSPATNGTTGCTTGTLYSGPVTVSTSETLYAIAGGTGLIDSSVVSAAYVINGAASTPIFSPVAGTYAGTQTVTISSSTGGSTICYTTDGSTPTANGAGGCIHGTTYTTTVSVASSLTLKAVASKAGFTDSGVGSAAYVINGAAATPTFSPVAGSYGPAQTVTISTATGGATLCYTTDGSTPTADGAGTCTHGTTYSTAITVSTTQTVKAIASKAVFSDSSVGSALYTINGAVSTPTFSPVAGTYSSAQSVTISTSTGGSTLYYTIDGTTPTTSSTLYSSPITVSVTTTVKALGVHTGFSNSSIGSALYTITTTTPPVVSSGTIKFSGNVGIQ